MNIKKRCILKNKGISLKGFTLIEVLISVAIFSILISLSIIAVNHYRDIFSKNNFKAYEGFKVTKNKLLFFNSINSIYDYFVKISEDNKKLVPYFKGEKKQIEYITLSSVFNFSSAAAVKVSGIESKEGFNLLYEEKSLENYYLDRNDEVIEYDYRVVIFKNLKDFEFSFYGITGTKIDEEQNILVEAYSKEDCFDGEKFGHMPSKIILKIDNGEVVQEFTFEGVDFDNRKDKLFNPPFD